MDNWFYAGIDKPLEDFVGDIEQRYWSITFWVLHGLHWLWDRAYNRSSPDFENFKSEKARRKEVT